MSSETLEARALVRDAEFTVYHRNELHQWLGASGYAHRGEHTWIVRPEEWNSLDSEALRAEVLDLLGVAPEELALLDKPGRLGPERRAIQARLDQRLLTLKESGGRMNLLARVLNWPTTGPRGDVRRMRMSIRRARQARELAASTPVATTEEQPDAP